MLRKASEESQLGKTKVATLRRNTACRLAENALEYQLSYARLVRSPGPMICRPLGLLSSMDRQQRSVNPRSPRSAAFPIHVMIGLVLIALILATVLEFEPISNSAQSGRIIQHWA